MMKEDNIVGEENSTALCSFSALQFLFPKVAQSCCLPNSFCFPLPLVVLLSHSALISLICLASLRSIFNSVILVFDCLLYIPSFLFYIPSYIYFHPLSCNPVFNSYSSFFVFIFLLPLSIISLSASHFSPHCFFLTPTRLLHYSDVNLLFCFLSPLAEDVYRIPKENEWTGQACHLSRFIVKDLSDAYTRWLSGTVVIRGGIWKERNS